MMNAIMHRDYQSNAPIRLYQYDDRIEIMNPGGLYVNARPENFPTVNDYRKPVIAEAMKVMDYVNMFSRGGKMQTLTLEMNDNGSNVSVRDKSYKQVLDGRMKEGEKFDNEDIHKHRKDIFRLFLILSPAQIPKLSGQVADDLRAFTEAMGGLNLDLKNLGYSRTRKMEDVIGEIRKSYGIGS